MRANHENPPDGSSGTYTENYRGYPLILQFREAGPERDCRAVWCGPVPWVTPWGRSWLTKLAHARELADRYMAALAFCALNRNPRIQSIATGTVELVATYPAVRS